MKNEITIQTLILWKFNDNGKWGTIKVNARNENEARERIQTFLKETNYLIEHPSLFEECYKKFTCEGIDVIDAVIV